MGLTGKILALGAAAGGCNVAHSQSYGAQARGGISQSEVVIAEAEILYPLVEEPNVVISLSQETYVQNRNRLGPGGLLIYDADLVVSAGGGGEFGFNPSRLASSCGNERGVTLVALGVVTGLTNMVRPEHILQAIEETFSGEVLESNKKCFLAGLEVTKVLPVPFWHPAPLRPGGLPAGD